MRYIDEDFVIFINLHMSARLGSRYEREAKVEQEVTMEVPVILWDENAVIHYLRTVVERVGHMTTDRMEIEAANRKAEAERIAAEEEAERLAEEAAAALDDMEDGNDDV